MLPAFFFTTNGKSEGLEDPKFVTTLASECVPVATKFKPFLLPLFYTVQLPKSQSF